MQVPCEFVKSRKNKDLLLQDGFLFTLNKTCDDIFYWTCVRKSSSSCGALAITKKVGNYHYISKLNNISHLHEPDQDAAMANVVRASLKRRAGQSFDQPGQIIQKTQQELIHITSAPFMPSKQAMRLVIHRERTRNEPSLPKNLHDFIVPDQYTKIEGEQFLIGHFMDENDVILVFSTKQNLRLLDSSTFWIMDGTFQCCPKLFYQLYSIHDQVGQKQTLPLVYGLLSNKTQRLYMLFLEMVVRYTLNNLSIHLSPKFIITDFELATIKACASVFPDAQHKCCFFHLSQNIFKHIQKEGLAKKYTSDSEYAHKMRHIAALAYLDPGEITEAFELIRDEIIPKDAGKVTDWFYKYYIGDTYERVPSHTFKLKRRSPTFPPRMWSVLDCVNANIPTTQNAIEYWHNHWNSLLNRKKMNIYKITITRMNERAKKYVFGNRKNNGKYYEEKKK